MIKKLRLRFVIVNMSIVTILLSALFCLLFFSTKSSMEKESLQMMRTIAFNTSPFAPLTANDEDREHFEDMAEAPEASDVRLPYFSVLVDEAGSVTDIMGGYFDLSNEEEINQVLQAAYDMNEETGILKEYNLRFLYIESPKGQSMVFADITREQSTLRNLGRNISILWWMAFVIFLIVSIHLSHWAVRPVEKSWEQQRQFVADASHELKTPLTVIMTDAELLMRESIPEEDKQKLAGGILAMSGQMRDLVERLLELARVENVPGAAVFSEVSLGEVVDEAVMMFEPVFFEKGMTLNWEMGEAFPVKGDAGQLKQLMDILLDNAAKYASAEGETQVTLSRKGHRRCVLEVANQGAPISKEDLTNLFKRFYRADKARALNHSYGLGLSIAQKIVERHHGKIHAESYGGYNRFIVELPIKKTAGNGKENHE